jgi:hypothetical protein
MYKKSSTLPEKKKNFPFSTEKDIIEHLTEEAQNKNLSVNALINDILTRYVTYYKHIERKCKVVIPNKSFQFMLDNIDEDTLFESITKNELDIEILFTTKKIPGTFENFIIYGLEGAGIMGGLLRHYVIYKDEQDFTNLLLEHNYDIKWSRIMGKAFSGTLQKMFQYNTDCTFLPNSVVIKIMEKHVID